MGMNRTQHQQHMCNKCGKYFSENMDYSLVAETVRSRKALQGAKDAARIKDNAFRDHARIENALSEYSKQILTILGKHDFSKITVKHSTNGDGCAGVIHISDLHLNELIGLAHNKYDFTVAARRFKLFALQAKRYLKAAGVKNVLLANTGDTLNSDRRLDEYLSQSTNRANATMLSVFLLEQFIIDLNQDFNVKVAFVTGNESRIKDEPGWSPVVATDNYDYTVFNILRYGMKSAKGVEFILGDPTELVVEVAGQNVLMLHGQQIRGDVETMVQKIKGKYVDRGVLIPFVIFGDVHSARIGDHFARGSSMAGANDYSDKGLQLSGRASQNVYLFYKNGNRDGIKIDLQNTQGIEGYAIIKELEAYNAKSAGKLHEGVAVVKILV
jgi:predicted phosphodiesterase